MTNPVPVVPVPLRIITVAFNRPDFIYYQYHSFCTFLKGPWEFIVFSDAITKPNDPGMSRKIMKMCKKLKLRYVRVPPYIQTQQGASPRAGNALDWALKNYVYNYEGLSLVMDSDMFLIKSFNPWKFMNLSVAQEETTAVDNGSPPTPVLPYDIGGVIQTISHNGYWVRYVWMALMLIHGPTIPHGSLIRFMNGVGVETMPTDAGGPMHYWLTNHPEVRVKPLKHMWSGKWEFEDYADSRYESPFLDYLKKEKEDPDVRGMGELISEYFYHYRAGSNWNAKNSKYIENRSLRLEKLFQEICPSFGNDTQVLIVCPPEMSDAIDSRNFKKYCAYFSTLENLCQVNIHPHNILYTQNEGFLKNLTDDIIEKVIVHYDDILPQKAGTQIYLNLETEPEGSPNYPEDQGLMRVWKRPSSSNTFFFRPSGGELTLPNFWQADYETVENCDQSDKIECWGLTNLSTRAIFRGTKNKEKKENEENSQTLDLPLPRNYPIKKYHHYQIVIIGRKLVDGDFEIQLKCSGDTFFGQLNSVDFRLEQSCTRIVWNFYNKFATEIGIELTLLSKKGTQQISWLRVKDYDKLFEIEEATLICVRELF